MANLNAFNRITKLQKILLLSNFNTITTSTALAAFFQTNRLTTDHTQQLLSSHRLTNPSSPRYTSYTRNLASTSQSNNIDEFRAREQKREEEFAKKQSEGTPPDEKKGHDESKQAKNDAIRNKILDAALQHVLTEGWSRQAIVRGAESVGLPGEVHGMFENGGYELVSHFVGKCNNELLKYLQNETNNGQMEVNDPLNFLIRAVKLRLQMIVPYKSQWPQAMALIALPPNTPTSLAQVLTMVDDICYYSGDRSVDFGWYTRRVGLATIFKMVEVYMLQDTSADHHETWEFLKNRMEEAAQIQMVLAQTGDMTHNFQRSFNSAFVTARNILGVNYNRR